MKPRSRAKKKAVRKASPAARSGESSAPRRSFLKRFGWLWFAAALFAGTLLLYWPAMEGPFVLDDYDLMESYSTVRTGSLRAVRGSGRPLLFLTYIANYRMSGFDPFGFHITNVALHGLNALLLWGLMSALAGAGKESGAVSEKLRPWLVYGVPALFAASPIQTESVSYISSRSEVLGTTFFLAALCVFCSTLRERNRWATAVLVTVLFAGAAASKQDKLMLPFVILLADYLILSQGKWRAMARNWPTYSLFGVGVVAGFVTVVRPFLFAVSAGFDLPWAQYLFTQFRMYFLYLRLLLVPFGLNLDHHIQPSDTIWQHHSWLALIALAAILAATLYYRERYRVAAFGALFFLLTLAPSSSIYPLLDFAAERRLYLPSVGFFVVAAVVLAALVRDSATARYGVLGCVLLVYGAGTVQRNRLWADDLRLWQDTADKSPEKYRPLTWLGKLYSERNRYVEAEAFWSRAEELVEPGSTDHAYLLSNLGLAHANLKDHAKAIGFYERAVKIVPGVPQLWANLAIAQIRTGRKADGWASFEKAFAVGIPDTQTYFLRGQERFQDGDYAGAAEDFQRASEISPEYAPARRNLEAARQMMRRTIP